MHTPDQIQLEFQPYVFRRTMAHELFFMSTSTFEAARDAPYPPLEGRLSGESFELMVKTMMAVITGPDGKLPSGHDIGCCFEQGAEFEKDAKEAMHAMIKGLWPEWEHVERMIERDICPPQARYGSAGSRTKRSDGAARPIAGATHREAGAWVKEMNTLYRELRDSVGRMIWKNWPESEPERSLVIKPAPAPGATVTRCYPELHASMCCLLVNATRNGEDTGWRGSIPLRRELAKDGSEHIWVRARVDHETAADVEVRYEAPGRIAITSAIRWDGPPKEEVRLAIHEGRSVIARQPDGVWRPALG